MSIIKHCVFARIDLVVGPIFVLKSVCSSAHHLKGLSVNDTSLPSPNPQIPQLKMCKSSPFWNSPRNATHGLKVCQLLRALFLRNHPLSWLKTLNVSHWRGTATWPEVESLAQQNLPASSDTTESPCSILGVKHFWGFKKQSLQLMDCLVTKNFPEIPVGTLKLLHGLVTSSFKHLLSPSSSPALVFPLM